MLPGVPGTPGVPGGPGGKVTGKPNALSTELSTRENTRPGN